VLDGEVDLVGVVRLPLAVALYYCDSHEYSLKNPPNGRDSASRAWVFHHYIWGH
jgi:hypothetical protein